MSVPITKSQTYWAEEHQAVTPVSSIALDARLRLVHRHGDFSIAYSTAVQPTLEYFGDESGYIAFRRRWGLTFALGDPVAPDAVQPELLRRFVKKYRRPSFVHITEKTATNLSKLDFRINDMGVDTNLDLATYTFAGKKKEWLRYADNWIRNHDYSVKEASFDEVGREAVEAVSESWRQTRTIKSKEVRFINRPIVMQDEPGVRKWFLFDPNNKLVAFLFFDPIYKDGNCIGYVTCIKRRHPDAPMYAEHAIMKRAIETFQSEGHQVVKLGLSPLANIENLSHRSNRLLHHTSRLYGSSKLINRFVYSFQGHNKYKNRFRGREEKLYYASPVMFNDFRFFCLVTLCGFF